jgi:hypothetical protein
MGNILFNGYAGQFDFDYLMLIAQVYQGRQTEYPGWVSAQFTTLNQFGT